MFSALWVSSAVIKSVILDPPPEFAITKGVPFRHKVTTVHRNRRLSSRLGDAQPVLRLSSDAQLFWTTIPVYAQCRVRHVFILTKDI